MISPWFLIPLLVSKKTFFARQVRLKLRLAGEKFEEMTGRDLLAHGVGRKAVFREVCQIKAANAALAILLDKPGVKMQSVTDSTEQNEKRAINRWPATLFS